MCKNYLVLLCELRCDNIYTIVIVSILYSIYFAGTERLVLFSNVHCFSILQDILQKTTFSKKYHVYLSRSCF